MTHDQHLANLWTGYMHSRHGVAIHFTPAMVGTMMDFSKVAKLLAETDEKAPPPRPKPGSDGAGLEAPDDSAA